MRIAGVEVGKVATIEPLPDSNAAELTMTIEDSGRPIHEDARLQIRPRLFLEGNLFVDLQPGSPSAPEMESGDTIPIQQTYNSVQLDEILTGLQSEVRGNMQLLLRELGDAFDRYGGAEGLAAFNRNGADAFRYTSQVNEAVLGTEDGDLAGFTRNFARVAQALNKNDTQLQACSPTCGSSPAPLRPRAAPCRSRSASCPACSMRPTRSSPTSTPRSRPSAPSRSRPCPASARPARRSTSPCPSSASCAPSSSADELRGLTVDLRATIPSLAQLTRRQIPFLEEARAVSSCFTNVIIPWSADEVGNGQTDGAGDPINPVYQETAYGLVGIGGESRSGDANGQYIRVGAGGGVNTVVSSTGDVGVTPFPIEGSEPDIDSSRKTQFRPNIPCENQEPPDMRSQPGPAPPNSRSAGASESLLTGPLRELAVRRHHPRGDRPLGGLDAGARRGSGPGPPRGHGHSADLREKLLEFDREQMPEYLRMLREGDFE